MMFRELRRSELSLGDDDTVKILNESIYGVLSTIGEDGYPYGIPVNYVYENDAIYFHCALEGHKLDNILFNSKVSFSIVGEYRVVPSAFTTRYKSVVVFGTAGKAQGMEKENAMKQIVEKYAPAFRSGGMKSIQAAIEKTCVIKINIEHISGKKSK